MRGLSLYKVEWETNIQNFNISIKFLVEEDTQLHTCRDLQSEIQDSLTNLCSAYDKVGEKDDWDLQMSDLVI